MSAQRRGDQHVIEQLSPSLQQWLTLERFHLHKAELFQNRSRDPDFDTGYFPQNCGAFELPCFWVRRKYLQMYGQQAQAENELSLFDGDGLEGRALFPMHPASLDHYKTFLSETGAEDASRQGLRIWAVPTASTRTVLAWPDEAPERALFIKTSLHSPIFGDRRLYMKTVARSAGLSQLIRESRAQLPMAVDFLPESIGYVPRQLADSGVIFRSIPQQIKDGRVLVAPLFSLFGGSVPLFLTVLARSGMQPKQFVEEVLCAPFARLWLEMSMRFGLMPESHGQDVMLALSPELVPLGRFVCRDFEGLHVDWELRRRYGLPMPRDMPHAWRWHETYATWGFRYGDLIWYKWQISLTHYMHFVLNELEQSLRQWHERGLVGGPIFEQDEVTMMFSRHLFQAIEELFGTRVEAQYNIYRRKKTFLIFLMKIRHEILQ